MCSAMQSWMIRKKIIEPSAATGRYSSRDVLIITSVSCASFTWAWISADVALVTSRPSMSGMLSRMVAGSAAASCASRSSSSCASVTLNSFCLRTSSCFCCSSSGFSTFTTKARIWSSRPSGVTKVDDRALCEQLRAVVRIRKLALDEKLELRVVVDLLASELDNELAPPATDHGPRQERFQDSIDILSHRFNQQAITHLDHHRHLLH